MSEEHLELSHHGQQRKDRILHLALAQGRRRRRRRQVIRAAGVLAGLVLAAGVLTVWTRPGLPPGPMAGPPPQPPVVAPSPDGAAAPIASQDHVVAQRDRTAGGSPRPVGSRTTVEFLDDRQLVETLAQASIPVCVIRVRGECQVYYADPQSGMLRSTRRSPSG
jgi:hypothetical protein